MCDPSLLMEYFYIFGKKEKFIITLNVQRHLSFFDTLKSLIGWNTLSVRRNVDGVGCRIFTPQVLLHSSAEPRDIFRALIAVHKTIFELKKETTECGNKSIAFEDSDEKVRKLVLDIVQRAYTFQKNETPKIIDHLVASGWNMDRYTFGMTSLPRIDFR
jgi:hypothetical protein